ncbi:alpha/beta hydrolase [Mesobacterium sp. TK19101]|uniref:Alpha/beta hydrolase n=1 Tax=Mesobacterium hydrothermale TaxID=3111907 RepID=A0ABU6HN47_9RHOB|nr:alpha/beta hydrolase [Mesobacterium sp. TK19101]MEC3862625.1 alpha/beta hydrolase [Mesobacterium sp. TK19101]
MTLPLIYLPGMMCDARLFGPQITALGGTAPLSAQDSTMQAMAAQLLPQLPDRFALIGLSMGGILAMELIRQAPGRVDRVALLDTNPLAETEEVKARRGPQIDRVRAGKLAEVMRDEMKPHYMADGPNRAALLDLCMDMALGLGPDVFVNQSCALRDRPDQCDTLRSFGGPALVLCGREDRLCPLHRHTLMQELLPNATLSVIDGAGHLPTLEKPTETTQALCHWLERP